MPITLRTQLEEPISAGARRLRLPSADLAALCAYMQDNDKVVFLQLRSQSATEVVMAQRCRDGFVEVLRAVDGTQARDWLSGTPVTAIRDEDAGAVATPPCDVCDPPNPWDAAVIGEGLELDRSDPQSPTLRIADTGVAAGDYGGAKINSKGQFTYIPPGWPASALPTFDPCACGPGSGQGGPVTAGDVGYVSCWFVGASNVQDAICQLEQWASGLNVDTGVMEITAGDGVTISGTTNRPTISLAPTGITPGDYGPYGLFTVNAFGQVTHFQPQDVPHPDIEALLPLHATFDASVSPAGKWEFAIDQANYNRFGVVRFVSPADIQNDSVPVDQQDWAMSYEGVLRLVQRELTSVATAEFDISQLPDVTSPSPQGTDWLAIYNRTADRHQKVEVNDFIALLPTSRLKAMGFYDPASASMGSVVNVANIVKLTDGEFRVDLTVQVSDPVLAATIRGDHPEAIITAQATSTTSILVKTYELAFDAGLNTLSWTPRDYPFNLLVFTAS